jgi:hypothetical protein
MSNKTLWTLRPKCGQNDWVVIQDTTYIRFTLSTSLKPRKHKKQLGRRYRCRICCILIFLASETAERPRDILTKSDPGTAARQEQTKDKQGLSITSNKAPCIPEKTTVFTLSNAAAFSLLLEGAALILGRCLFVDGAFSIGCAVPSFLSVSLSSCLSYVCLCI